MAALRRLQATSPPTKQPFAKRSVTETRLFVEWLGGRLGYKDKKDWYRIKPKDFVSQEGRTLLMKYNHSLWDVLGDAYPDDDWCPWMFKAIKRDHWKDVKLQEEYLTWFGHLHKLKYFSDWYHVTTKDFTNNYGATFLSFFGHTSFFTINTIYHHFNWIPWKFLLTSKGFWQNQLHHVQYLHWLGKILQIKKMSDFYKISQKDFDGNYGKGLLSYYDESPINVLQLMYDQFFWRPWKSKKTLQGTNPNTGAIINAMGKSVNNLGNFDECLELNDTRYCLLRADLPNVPALVGWCVPGACDGPALEEALDTFLRKNISDLFFGQNVAVRINILVGGLVVQRSDPYPIKTPPGIPKIKAACPNYKESRVTTSAVVVLSVIIMFALLTLIASLVDYYLPTDEVVKIEHKHKPIKYDHEPSESDTQNDGNMVALKDMSQVSDEEPDREDEEVSPISCSSINRDMFGVKLLLAFSALHNLKSLGAKERSTETQFLNGIRVLSMFYVMLGHTNAFMLSAPVLDLYHVITQIFKTLPFQIITAGFFAVDTFFFLSGFLVCLALIELLKKEKANCFQVNWFLVFFHRWWRLTPLYFLTIWISTYLALFFTNGPLSTGDSQMFGEAAPNCEQYWYMNILYINNFFPWNNTMNYMCLVWGWYLANDMQLFAITPFFLVLYLKNKKIGIIAAFTLLIASYIGVGIYIGVNGLTLGDIRWFTDYYVKPWSRVGPYFIGSALAILWKEKGQVKISAPLWFLACLSASILLITTVFGTYTNSEFNWSVVENVFYYTFSRTGFILGLAIFCYLMLNKQVVFIRTILSYHYWTPLARLSYGAYLLHPVIMVTTYLSTRVAFSWDIWSITVYYSGFIILSYSFSFVLWIVYEKPLANLETVIITRIKGSRPVV